MTTAARLRATAIAGLVAAIALGAATARAGEVPDTLAERVRPCAACHGQEGRATPHGYFPRIAGKPAGYLADQLLAFRDGRRQNPLMADLVRHLSDDYLREIAGHFAGLDLPYASPAAPTLDAVASQRARALVTQGDATRGVPACTRCHGEALTGVQPRVPGLLGLPRDYLLGQLGAWRNGTRRARAPDCMARVARALSDEDLGLVAAWLPAQALPADAHPAPARVPGAVSGAVPGAVPATLSGAASSPMPGPGDCGRD